MLLTVFGVPTAAAARGLEIVKSFFAVMVGEFDFIAAATMEELRAAWANITRQHVIYYSEGPTGDVVAFFRQAQAPMLLFADDPVAVAAALQRERGLSQIQSARSASISVSVLEEIWVAPDVMLINAGHAATLSVGNFVRSLAAYLSVLCTDEQVLEVTEHLRRQGSDEIDPNQLWVNLHTNGGSATARLNISAAEEKSLHCYLGSYRPIAAQKPLNVITWPAEIFVSVDKAGTALGERLDMTGRQRFFIDGPWFGLPKGRWEATIEFEVAHNLMSGVMLVGVVAAKGMGGGRLTLPESGSYTCTFVFEHEDALTPIAIHFTLDRGMLQGYFRLVKVTFQKLSAHPERRLAG